MPANAINRNEMSKDLQWTIGVGIALSLINEKNEEEEEKKTETQMLVLRLQQQQLKESQHVAFFVRSNKTVCLVFPSTLSHRSKICFV